MHGKVKYQDAHRLDIEPQGVSSLAIQKILLIDIYCDLNIEGQMHQTQNNSKPSTLFDCKEAVTEVLWRNTMQERGIKGQ